MHKAASEPQNPMGPSQVTVGFDVGGTNVRAALIAEDGTYTHHMVERTPDTAPELEDTLVRIVEDLRVAAHEDELPEPAAVGLAVAGFVDPECETVRFAPHLPWRDAPVRRALEKRLDVPVRLEHDANAAAWGEHRFGAGREATDWVYVSVGTGIGAAIIHDGEIYRGAFGTAPEFGHVVIEPGGRQCSCGKKGCLERYASGTALPDTTRELRGRYETSLPTGAAGHQVTAAAREGDPLGRAVMDDFARRLGTGLSLIVDVLDPELIVLGGGVADDADLFLPLARKVMAESIVGPGFRPLPRLATSELGGPAGMIGVADLARSTYGNRG